MIHPAAFIESGDWAAAGAEAALAAGKRRGVQMQVLNAALEYFLVDEQCCSSFGAPGISHKKLAQLEKRSEELRSELMKSCEALLRVVPVDRRRQKQSREAKRA